MTYYSSHWLFSIKVLNSWTTLLAPLPLVLLQLGSGQCLFEWLACDTVTVELAFVLLARFTPATLLDTQWFFYWNCKSCPLFIILDALFVIFFFVHDFNWLVFFFFRNGFSYFFLAFILPVLWQFPFFLWEISHPPNWHLIHNWAASSLSFFSAARRLNSVTYFWGSD